MKNLKITLFAIVIAALLFVGYNSFHEWSAPKTPDDIAHVQQTLRSHVYPPMVSPFNVYSTWLNKLTCGEWVQAAARVEGKVEWKTFHAEGEPLYVVVVQAVIKPSAGENGRGYKKAKVQFLLNRASGYFEVAYIGIDGKSVGISGMDLFSEKKP